MWKPETSVYKHVRGLRCGSFSLFFQCRIFTCYFIKLARYVLLFKTCLNLLVKAYSFSFNDSLPKCIFECYVIVEFKFHALPTSTFNIEVKLIFWAQSLPLPRSWSFYEKWKLLKSWLGAETWYEWILTLN